MGKKHLTLTERVKIETLIKEGYKLSTIAKRIGYSRAAISKEIQRSTLRKAFGYKRPTRITKNMYSARYAQTLADHKKQSKYFSWNEKKTDEKKKLIADYVLNKNGHQSRLRMVSQNLEYQHPQSIIGLITVKFQDLVIKTFEHMENATNELFLYELKEV